MVKIPAVARRAGWNLGDQMLVSLTNSVLSFMVANSVDAPSFGGFSVAFTVFALVISGSRALATSPLNIRFTDAEEDESHRSAGYATGTALTIGFVTGVGCGIAGLLLDGPASAALLALAVVMPIVVVQDSYRYVFFSRGRPSAAALSDGTWTLFQLSAVAALLVFGAESVGLLILAWGVSALAAVAMGIKQSGTFPDPRRAPAWFREHRDLTGYLFASAATAHGANQGAMLVIAGVGTVQALGSLRGAALILGPTSILSSAAMSFAIPEFSRRRKTMTDRQWLLAAVGVSGAVAFLGLCWGSFFLLVPDQVGIFLLDDTWQGTSEILLAAVVAQVFACGTIGPVVMLYAIDRASSTLPIQIVLGSLTFLGGVGGVTLAGAPGAQWGFALANLVVIPFWFYRLWRELKKRRDLLDQEAEVDPDPVDDETTAVAARPSRSNHFMDDLSSAQMQTMIMPRIEPREPASRPAMRPVQVPRLDAPRVDADATQAVPTQAAADVTEAVPTLSASEATQAVATPSPDPALAVAPDAEATQVTLAKAPRAPSSRSGPESRSESDGSAADRARPAGSPHSAPADRAPAGRTEDDRAGNDRAGNDRADADQARDDRARDDRAHGDRVPADLTGATLSGADLFRSRTHAEPPTSDASRPDGARPDGARPAYDGVPQPGHPGPQQSP
ncbi:hypothetical protein I4I73_25790, partial [Pseudonocardia sp. KRD-184]|nr:hypothetical protein [Pseudonocardia oceani]